MFTIIKAYFHSLTRQGPGRGYYTKPSKSVLIVHPYNPEAVKLLGRVTGLRCVQKCVILEVILGTTSPKVIVLKIIQ